MCSIKTFQVMSVMTSAEVANIERGKVAFLSVTAINVSVADQKEISASTI